MKKPSAIDALAERINLEYSGCHACREGSFVLVRCWDSSFDLLLKEVQSMVHDLTGLQYSEFPTSLRISNSPSDGLWFAVFMVKPR